MVTGAGDEELRLWKIFDEKTSIIPYDLRWINKDKWYFQSIEFFHN